MIRRHLIGAALALTALGLASCGKPEQSPSAGANPKELTFAILPAEGQQSMEPMWSRLGDLRVPTTIVTGARDEKFTAIGARLPGVQYVVDCGHAVPVERPEELASILNEQFG